MVLGLGWNFELYNIAAFSVLLGLELLPAVVGSYTIATTNVTGGSEGNRCINGSGTDTFDVEKSCFDYCDIYTDTIRSDILSMNPLHMTSFDTSTDDNGTNDTHKCDSTSVVGLQAVTSNSKSLLLSRYARNVLLQQKVVKAYQLPDRIRDKRRTFVTAYSNIGTFVQSQKYTCTALDMCTTTAACDTTITVTGDTSTAYVD